MFRKSKLSRLVLFLAILATLLAACAGAAAPNSQEAYYDQGFAEAPAEAYLEAEDAARFNAISSPLPEVRRIVIKDASMTIVVDDPSGSMESIARMADDMGGFVVSANLYQMRTESGAEVPRASITIRVPAEKLDDALTQIRAESELPPQSENISAQDVTREYTDLQSRLRNLEAAEAQLQEIMASAVKTEDVLNVYNELVRVREEIEIIQGQIQYYEQSAALSAVSVELLPNEAVQPLTIGGWQPVGVAKTAVQALINTLKVLANIAIWIVIYVLPVLLVIFVIFVLPLSWLWRTWRRRRARRKAAAPQPAPPEGEEDK
jgi:hypothetical protein